jgi:serine/threonine-protein kinase
MHKDVKQRYATVDALRSDVERFMRSEPLAVRPASTGYRAGKFLGRHWRALTAAAALIAFGVGLAAFSASQLAAARNAALEEAGRTQRIQRFMLSLFDGGEHAAAPADSLRVITLIDRGVQQARALETEPAVQAELFHTLGTLYARLGQFDRADGLLQSALDRRRRVFGTEHPAVAESLVAYGELRVQQARVEDGERLVREGLDMLAQLLPADHPDVARATVALGKVLEERGAYTDAIRLFEASVNVYSRSRDATPDLADSLMHLANVHYYAGHLDLSESLNRRLLAMYRQLYGSQHPLVADTLINLGNIDSSRGRYVAAGDLHRQALDVIRPWYGDDHPETASAMTILAQALVYQKRFDDALPLLRNALAIQERTYGSVHPRVAFALNEVGSASLQQRALDEAEVAFDRVVSIYRRVYGKHYRLGVAMSNLASVHLAREQFTRAEELFREALRIFAETLPPNHLNTAIAQVKLGRSLVRQQRFAEAEGHLLSGYGLLTSQTSPSVSWLQTARQDLVSTYEALRRPDEARRFRAELESRPQASVKSGS